MSDNFYTTSQGYRLEFLPIPGAIRRFHLSHVEPQPPTYIVKSELTKVEEEFYHNEKTIETDEEKAQWQEYQRALAAYTEKFLKVCLIKGVRVHASMDAWLAEQKELEIPVPDSEIERRIEWITETVLATKEDFENVVTGVIRASGAPEETIAQIEATFRGEVGELERAQVGRPASAANGRSVVLQQPLGRMPDGIRDGNTAKPVRQMDEARPRARACRKTH